MEGPPPPPLGGGDDSACSSHRRTSPIAIKSVPSTTNSTHNNVILSPAGAFTAAFEVTDFNLGSSCSDGSPRCAASANNTPCVSLGPWDVYLMLDANNNLFIKALDTETTITSWKQISKTVRAQNSFEQRPLLACLLYVIVLTSPALNLHYVERKEGEGGQRASVRATRAAGAHPRQGKSRGSRPGQVLLPCR